MEAFLYENHTDSLTDHHYIKLNFEGPEKNKFGVGASVLLYYDDNIIYQELIPSRGFQSSMDYGMTIGLGNADTIDSLRVIWPDDKTQKFESLNVNQTISLKHADAAENYQPPSAEQKKPLMKELANSRLIAHEENAGKTSTQLCLSQ